LVQIRYWLSFDRRFDLTLLVGLQVDYKTLLCLLRALGQHLDPAWKVVPALVTNIVLKTRRDVVLPVENDFVRDLHDEEASFWGCHISSTDHPLGKAFHRTRRMKMDTNLISNNDLHA